MKEIPRNFIMPLDNETRSFTTKEIDYKGIEVFCSDMLFKLDCSRVKDGMRLMQTIGVPYCFFISKFLLGLEYARTKKLVKDYTIQGLYQELVDLHERNLKYEETNPPIVYDKSKPCKNVRRKKTVKRVEATIAGFDTEDKPVESPPAQVKLSKRTQFINSLNFKIQ